MPTQLSRKRVEALPGIALPNGIFSAATVIPMQDVHEENGVDWFGLGCGPANLATFCFESGDDLSGYPAGVVEEGTEKEFARPESMSTPPITVYAGAECSVPGWTYGEGVEQARATLNVGEQAALEEWAWAQMADTAAIATNGGDASIIGTLSELETALAAIYRGVGVVHVPLQLSAYMQSMGLAIKDGSRLRTLTGHYVSVGAGYPGTGPVGETTPDGSAWMFISGPVTIRQGVIADVPDEGSSVNTRKNDRTVLVERSNVVQIDCGSFAALATRTCCSANGS